MEIRNFTDEEKQKIMAQYTQMSFASLKKSILQDLERNRNESVIYRRYQKENVFKFLESPQRYEEQIRELSCYLYIVSSHYRRLVDYFSTILLYHYNVIPVAIPEKNNKKKYNDAYLKTVRSCDKYNLQHEAIKAIKIVVREGVFFGLRYESKDSFYIKPVPSKRAKISGIEDGTYVYQFDLNYFNGRPDLLQMYGIEFMHAYERYKGNPEKGINPDKTRRWYEPKNGICLKADESDPYHSLPLFTGLLTEVFSIEDYRMLQKAKKENDNYHVVAAQVPTDQDGIPLLAFADNKQWYEHIVSNIDNTGVGVFMTPFEIKDISLASTKSSDSNDVVDAQENFWMASGVSSLVFGSAKATSSSSLTLSVKPDEQLAYMILLQFQRYFNKWFKMENAEYQFKIEFTQQSIFNNSEYVDKYAKAAQYGLPVKTMYATSLGLSPLDVYNLAILEEDILELGKNRWKQPLISSNTMSNGTDEEAGRPTNASENKPLTEAGEQTAESNQNANR